MDLIADISQGNKNDAEFALVTLLIGLGVTALVALFVWFALGKSMPRWQGPATAAVVIIGALISLLAAL